MKAIMDHKLFEEAISPYTNKVVDKDNPNIVTYYYSAPIEITLTTVAGEEIKQPKKWGAAIKYGCITPIGTFDTIADAARVFNIQPHSLITKIRLHEKKGSTKWALIKND